MKFIVHIGQPKTGTSSLQRFLFDFKEQLKKMGINYLHHPATINGNRWFEPLRPRKLKSLADGLTEARVIDDVRSDLKRGAKEGIVNIISAETLSNLSPSTIKKIFPYKDKVIVAYIRNELEFLASSYAQYIHANDKWMPIGEYLGSRENFSNGVFLDKFKREFAHEFKPRVFLSDRMAENSIICDFVSEFLPKLKNSFIYREAKSFRQMNTSITDKVIIFKKQMLDCDHDGIRNSASSYKALAALSHQYGERFRLPTRAQFPLVQRLAEASELWGPKYFDQTVIFDYAAYSFTDEFAEQPLDSSEFEEMKKAYYALKKGQ